jgi:fatty-acyl-CoA synthase
MQVDMSKVFDPVERKQIEEAQAAREAAMAGGASAEEVAAAHPFPGDEHWPMHTEMTIGDYFRRQVQVDPNQDFIVYPDRLLRWTYGQFDERTGNLAKGLLAIGLEPGDHLGVWARNVPDWLTFMFATAKIGVVLVTMNPAYKSNELDYVLKQSDMSTLCVIDAWRDVNYVQIIRELIPEAKLCERGHLKTDSYPHLKNLVFMGQEKHRGFYSLQELLLLGEHLGPDSLKRARMAFDNNDVANMQYTSGTTGFPKGVMLTHRNILNDGWNIGEREGLTSEDRVCLPVPFFHCFGCVLGVMAILTHHATMVMVEEYSASLVLQALDKEKATAVYGVPTMFIGEYNHPDFDQYDLSHLNKGIIAGAAVPPEVTKTCMTKMGMTNIVNCYGLTETSPVFTETSWQDDDWHKQNTVGQKHPPVSVRVIDPADGHICGPGEIGEVCCKGYNVMKGYYKMPEKTAEAIDADGYLHSGDLGSFDEDGYYHITGRIKDMIIRGGENIYPLEIENFLLSVPGVMDAQVVGCPDEKYGEIVVAFIKAREGFELTEAGIRDYSIKRIARFKVPKYVFFVDDYPETPSKKVQKYKLREMAEDLVAERLSQQD